MKWFFSGFFRGSTGFFSGVTGGFFSEVTGFFSEATAGFFSGATPGFFSGVTLFFFSGATGRIFQWCHWGFFSEVALGFFSGAAGGFEWGRKEDFWVKSLGEGFFKGLGWQREEGWRGGEGRKGERKGEGGKGREERREGIGGGRKLRLSRWSHWQKTYPTRRDTFFWYLCCPVRSLGPNFLQSRFSQNRFVQP